MARLRPWVHLIGAIVLCSCASRSPANTERLLVSPPPDWNRVYEFNNDQTRLAEFVPAGERATEWQSKLFLESHAGMRDTDPIEILLAEASRLQENCTFVQQFNLFSGLENGFPTSVRLVMCGENEPVGEGEVSIMKAIQGDNYLYVIRLVRRVEPFEINAPDVEREEIAAWSEFFSRIKVCSDGSGEHACPGASD